MIVRPDQVKKSIEFQSSSNFILVYGPNEGLAQNIINQLLNRYKMDGEVDEIIIYGKDLDSEMNILIDEVKSFSMFASKKVIRIEKIKESHVDRLAEIEKYLNSNIFILIKSDNLNKKSKIRSFFEKSKSAYSIACYEDDMRSKMSLIQEFQTENLIKFSKECKDYLLQHLSIDRLVSLSELEKILLLPDLEPKQDIGLANVRKIFNDGSNNSIQKIIEHTMYGRINQASKSIHKIYSEGVNSVALIRSMLNFLTRIHLTQIELKKKKNFEDAIKILKPPVFWKDKDQFQTYCNKWPSKQISLSIGLLVNAEYECKSNSYLSNELGEKYIISIANTGNSFFRTSS